MWNMSGIIALITVIQVKNSGAMEVFALKSLLNFFQRTGVSIKMIVTDRSTSVRAMIEVDFPEILHQFDVWYLT